jgi:hypothetical protein
MKIILISFFICNLVLPASALDQRILPQKTGFIHAVYFWLHEGTGEEEKIRFKETLLSLKK